MGKHELLIRPDDAVLLVDITHAFLKGGGLPVPGGDDIVEPAARVAGLFPWHGRYMAVDCHPAGHVSLASSYLDMPPLSVIDAKTARSWYKSPLDSRIGPHARFAASDLYAYLRAVKTKKQVLWPDHAIVGTREAEPHDLLKQVKFSVTLLKGGDPACDSYSAFFDNRGRTTRLGEKMLADGVKRIFVCGLALDYCVGWSALDAAEYGFETFVMEDLTRGIAESSVNAMKADLAKRGVRLVSSESLVFP